VEIREARAAEIPWLKTKLEESGGELVDLEAARVFVAVEDGALLGMFALRMVWQGEPLLIFPECENRIKRSRAGYLLFRAACEWLRDRNRTGIGWFFAITRSEAVKAWAPRLGLLEQYVGATTLTKCLGTKSLGDRPGRE
jgi:hypothetical protein